MARARIEQMLRPTRGALSEMVAERSVRQRETSRSARVARRIGTRTQFGVYGEHGLSESDTAVLGAEPWRGAPRRRLLGGRWLWYARPRLNGDPVIPPIDARVRTMTPSRLRLVDGTLELLSAAIDGRNSLEGLLGVPVAEAWEGFPGALPILRASYEGKPEGHTWGCLFFIKLEVPTLVGFGGFKGSPSPDGVVEIGYAIAPAFRGQGLATDAVAQMVQRAFVDMAVRAVDAHTLGHDNPSTRVLQKIGFRKIAEIEDPDDGPIWQWRLERPTH